MFEVNFHELAKRQFDSNAPFTTWSCDNEEILSRVYQAIKNGYYKNGNVEGSLIVSISPENIFTAVVELREGQQLFGTYEPRRGTTYAIKSLSAKPLEGQEKMPAKSCEAIVYLIDGNYSIVSVNGSPEEEGTPINPMTLLRNYFMIGKEQAHGTNLAWSDLEATLHKSILYWDNKANLG